MAWRKDQKGGSLLIAAVGLATLLLTTAAHAATVAVINLDGAGEGFNDPTARGPEWGNPGVTLGQLRLNAFQEAADRWAAILDSSVVISAEGNFDSLSCDAHSAIVGSAGPNSMHRDFPGAPVANTWYVQAVANSIAGVDLSGSSDMGAAFNSAIDNGCLTGVSGWYYGFDGHPGAGQLDFIPTLLHEIAHGLGFLVLVDLDTGAKFSGFDDAYMLNLEDHSTGIFYPDMTNAERVAASTNTGNLHWVGANVRANSGLLSAGRTGDHVHMYAPSPNETGSSVSHFDRSLTPDELMEPFDTPTSIQILTEALLEDVGWILLPLAPTRTDTPTGTPTVIATFTARPSATATPTLTRTYTSTPTPTISPTNTPTPTPTCAAMTCPGDCDGDRQVEVGELVTGVNIALEIQVVSACLSFDGNCDGEVSIAELVRAVNAALHGCPPASPPTP